MRIVILTPIPLWHPGTSELMKRLENANFSVIAFDIWSLQTCDGQGKINDLRSIKSGNIFGKLLNRLCRKKIILKLINNHDILDIHWCDPNYIRYFSILRKKEVKIISTVFGSDFYRVNEQKLSKLGVLFSESDRVMIGANMKEDVISVFPEIENKIVYNQYGSERLDVIVKLMGQSVDDMRSKWGIEKNDVVVSLGYNAKKEQQHIVLLDVLNELPENILNNIVVILPLTYGSEEQPEYFKYILSKSKNCNVRKMIILDEKLSDNELAESKLVSDITINIQTTDALSSSVKESFAAGNTVIVGKWLPYNVYNEIGLYFYSSEIVELKEVLLIAIKNLDADKERCKLNTEKIMTFASWASVMPLFINTYNEIAGEWNR